MKTIYKQPDIRLSHVPYSYSSLTNVREIYGTPNVDVGSIPTALARRFLVKSSDESVGQR